MDEYSKFDKADEEKVNAYVEAIIEAVRVTRQIASQCRLKASKAFKAIETHEKDTMWIVLQDYMKKYRKWILATGWLQIVQIDYRTYEKMTSKDVELQLRMMIGVIYTYETISCMAREAIKAKLKQILKRSGVFTEQEMRWFAFL